ncbi:hypothetical protein SCH4B_4593 [Ruegeria sp. TrichCH4B]|nr:hypothetical protein SCH4B_4593 [Ruegeria sp. TrichCH4B]
MGHVETSNCSCVSRACVSRRQEIRLDVRVRDLRPLQK